MGQRSTLATPSRNLAQSSALPVYFWMAGLELSSILAQAVIVSIRDACYMGPAAVVIPKTQRLSTRSAYSSPPIAFVLYFFSEWTVRNRKLREDCIKYFGKLLLVPFDGNQECFAIGVAS